MKALGDTVEEPKIHRLNLQPAKGGAFDSNRYRLHFFKETKEELEKKKQLAYLPVHRLNEVCSTEMMMLDKRLHNYMAFKTEMYMFVINLFRKL